MSSPSSATPLALDRVSLHHPTTRGGTTPSEPALRDVSLHVGAGERVAVVGPSGAGKSTILSLANTSLAPTSGSVRLFGDDPSHLDPGELRAVRRRVGTVHQHLHLAGPLRVVHNVNAGHLGHWSSWRAWRSLARPVDVDRAREALASLGIEDKLWERTDRLSGGERQRVAIARVLVQGADLVLADEPVSALDPARSREVLTALCEIAADGRSLLVSLHAFDLALEFFDRVIGLRAGQIVFDRPPTEVSRDDAA